MQKMGSDLRKPSGQGRDRTADLAVFSRTLYRLSYLPEQSKTPAMGVSSGPDGI